MCEGEGIAVQGILRQSTVTSRCIEQYMVYYFRQLVLREEERLEIKNDTVYSLETGMLHGMPDRQVSVQQ